MKTQEKWWESEDIGEEPVKRSIVSVEERPALWTLGFCLLAGGIAWLVMQFAE